MKFSNKNILNMDIPNWSIIDPDTVCIQVLKFEDEDSFIYRSSVVIFLSNDPKRSRGLVIMTDIYNESIRDCLIETVHVAKHLFPKISSTALLLDEEGNVTEKILIEDVLNDYEEEEDSPEEYFQFPENKTIH